MGIIAPPNPNAGGGSVKSYNGRQGVVTGQASDVEGLFTAEGQLFVGTGSATGELLAPGSAGEVLTIGGADPSGLEWATPTGGVSSYNTRTGAVVSEAADVEELFTAEGQLFVGTGNGTGELLAKGGSAGEVLTVGGADPSGLEWTTPVTEFNGETGDVLGVAVPQGTDSQASLSGAYTVVDPATAGVTFGDHVLNGNVTYTFPTAAKGKGFTLFIDNSGGHTVTWPTIRGWAGPSSVGTPPVIPTGKFYCYFFCPDGTNWDGTYGGQVA